MKTFNMVLSLGGSLNVSYVPIYKLGNLDCAPGFYSDLSWYMIDDELVGFGVNKIVAPISGKFLLRFEHAFLGGVGCEFGYAQEFKKWVEWEPIGSCSGSNDVYYKEGYATLELTSE